METSTAADQIRSATPKFISEIGSLTRFHPNSAEATQNQGEMRTGIPSMRKCKSQGVGCGSASTWLPRWKFVKLARSAPLQNHIRATRRCNGGRRKQARLSSTTRRFAAQPSNDRPARGRAWVQRSREAAMGDVDHRGRPKWRLVDASSQTSRCGPRPQPAERAERRADGGRLVAAVHHAIAALRIAAGAAVSVPVGRVEQFLERLHDSLRRASSTASASRTRCTWDFPTACIPVASCPAGTRKTAASD